MNLKDYMKIENKVERLTQFFNDNGQWQVDYMENEDFINGYSDILFESEIYKGEVNQYIIDAIEYLESINKIDYLYNFVNVEIIHGFSRVTNELASYSLGEIEVQLSGLYDNNTKINCIYTELIKGMKKEDILKAENESDFYISNDYLYIDSSYDRASLILNDNDFMKSFYEDFQDFEIFLCGNYLEFKLSVSDILNSSGQGQKIDIVTDIQENTSLNLDRTKMIKELDEYGAWDNLNELKNEDLEQKLIWIFSNNEYEENEYL